MTVITVTSNADYGDGTLRQAVLDAQSGDVIKFDSSLSDRTITLSSGLWLNKSLTFDGADAPNLTLSGGNKSNIFWMGGVDANLELNVKDLTFADSYYDAQAGGAIYAQENSTINIDNVDFVGNVSDGGAIHAQQGSYITVNDSSFIDNDGASISDKEYATGAISLFAFGELRINNSHFEGNKGFNGGAVHVTSSDLFVENSTFIDNDSTPGKDRINYIPGAGGAIYADAATVPRDEKFYGLLPEHELEGEQEGGIISVNNSHFEGNKASGQGGAMALWGYSQDQVIVTNNTVVDNEVILNKDNMAEGGGIWLMGYGTVENNTIANNRSEDKGGGLFIWGEVPTTISNTTFSDNQAAKGGAIYSDIWATQIDIKNVSFDDNSATEGGVLFTNGISPVYVQDSQVSNNTAADLVNLNPQSDISGITYGAAPDPSPDMIEPPLSSSGIQLTDSGWFAGKPNFVPADNSGLFVWSNDNNWKIEATGDWDSSRFNGKLVADKPIEDLSSFKFEANDSVWYADDSRQVVQFSMNVANQWTDGISFKVPDQTNVFLEMEDSANTPVKAGYYMVDGYSLDSQPSYDPSLMSEAVSGGLELDDDALFAGKPNYTPSQQSGLMVWNTDEVWHMEATGTSVGSRYSGRIVSDQPIEDLSTYKFEKNDVFQYADSSQKVVEFSVGVLNQWTDGMSFRTADDASVFLELDNSDAVPVKAGMYLQEINLV